MKLRTSLLVITVVCLSSVSLGAQPTSDALRLSHFANGLGQNADREPLSKRFMNQQLAAAAAGMIVLGAAGGFIGARSSTQGAGGFQDIANAAAGAVLGGVLGSAIGVQWFSHSRGHQSPFLATLAGAAVGTLGLAGGSLVFVTVPMGAVLGYNVARR